VHLAEARRLAPAAHRKALVGAARALETRR
jgi:hypothetical protein